MSIENFKKALESELLISKWSPTNSQLELIAKRLKEFKGKASRSNISNLVLEIVETVESACLEGEDNSDLTTLLILATKTSSND